jgi:hypothetical protein
MSYRTEMQTYDADRFANFIPALRLGLNNPLGVGPGQSFLTLDYATHNLYLRTFSENGIIGFLTFSAFALVTLVRSLVLAQKAFNAIQRSLFALIAAALCGTLLNSFTIDTLHWRHFWLVLALGWMPAWTTMAGKSEAQPSGRAPQALITPGLPPVRRSMKAEAS